MEPMIRLTRLNGPGFALNPDLIERADSTPDTVITLVDGTRFMVAEDIPEVIDRITRFRASILCMAALMDSPPAVRGTGTGVTGVTGVTGAVIPFPRET
jgi:flagellar protein FlbD